MLRQDDFLTKVDSNTEKPNTVVYLNLLIKNKERIKNKELSIKIKYGLYRQKHKILEMHMGDFPEGQHYLSAAGQK